MKMCPHFIYVTFSKETWGTFKIKINGSGGLKSLLDLNWVCIRIYSISY